MSRGHRRFPQGKVRRKRLPPTPTMLSLLSKLGQIPFEYRRERDVRSKMEKSCKDRGRKRSYLLRRRREVLAALKW